MPGPADLTRLHAHEQAALLRAGELTSRELTEAHLAARSATTGRSMRGSRSIGNGRWQKPTLRTPGSLLLVPRVPLAGPTRCSASRLA